jgi:hypothetical protein
MRTKTGALWLGAMVFVAAMAVSAGAAVAGPVPRPPSQKQDQKQDQKQVGQTGHIRTVHHHPRPRAVVRCQNDETDQIDEFGDDVDEPRHSFTPTESAGRCSGDALGIARVLAGEHARPRVARPVR